MTAVLPAAEGLRVVAVPRRCSTWTRRPPASGVRSGARSADHDRQFGAAERRLLGDQRGWATTRAHGRVLEPAVGPASTCRQGDVQHLDVADASVDTVVSTYSLCTVADPAAVLREARRVLVPGGRLVLVEHGPARSRWIRAAQRLINPFTQRWQADDLLRDPRALAEAAGFAIVEADQDGVGGLAHRVSAEPPR